MNSNFEYYASDNTDQKIGKESDYKGGQEKCQLISANFISFKKHRRRSQPNTSDNQHGSQGGERVRRGGHVGSGAGVQGE